MAQIAFTSKEKLLKLLSTAPVSEGYVRVLGPNLLGLGTDPLHPTHAVDLAGETLIYRDNDEVALNLAPSSIQEPSATTASSSCGSEKPAPAKEGSATRNKKGSPANKGESSPVAEN